MIKAVFFDIDGTLVSFDTHKVPQSTIYALEELKRKGIKRFIATGRSWRQIQKIREFPEFDGYVTLNGSCCTTGKGEVIFESSIPKEDLINLAEFHSTRPFPVEFVYNDRETMTEASQVVIDAWAKVNVAVPPIVDMASCSKDNVFQLGIFLNRKEESELKIAESYMPNCKSMRWSPDFFDIIPKDSSKSNGIDKMLECYGIKLSETMTFGDGGNDIDMIKHAAIGVAMGNAADEVKQAADYVTTSVDSDGILNALTHFGIL